MEERSISQLDRHLEWKDIESNEFKLKRNIEFFGMNRNKKCFSCGIKGSDKKLEPIECEFIKTNGNPVFVKKGYLCQDCKWRIVKNDK